MGRVESTLPPAAVQVPLPWGPVIRGVRWGAASDAILLLHEPGADLDAWGALPALLAQTLGMAAVAVDLPGHGLSDDPWEAQRTGEVVRVLAERGSAPSRDAVGASPPRREAHRLFVIAAASIAWTAHALASDLSLAGLVLLSPSQRSSATIDVPCATPSASIAKGEESRMLRTNVPRLFFAGSLAGDDLETARRLASAAAGWTAVTSMPVSERGTRLLATPWQARIEEEIVAFLRDCQHRTPNVRPSPRLAPPPAG